MRAGSAGGPPRNGPNAGSQLVEIEGLAQVVVRPGVQALDAIGDGVSGGQQDDRRRGLAGADVREEVQAGTIGQHPVQHDGAEHPGAQRGARLLQGGGGISHKPMQAEPDL